MKTNLTVSVAPHWHSGLTIRSSMVNFIIALIPATAWGIYKFGPSAAKVVALSVLTAVVIETLLQLLMKKPVTVMDGSAALTGLLLALLLPAEIKWWLPVVGVGMAILMKTLFGGLGAYPFNPVLVGWVVLKLSWATDLLTDPDMTPLMVLRDYGAGDLVMWELKDLLVGDTDLLAATIGTFGAGQIALLIGGIYLLARGTIRWHIPAAFIVGVAAFSAILYLQDPDTYASPLFHLISGSVLLGAFFLATDYTTSPVTTWGMILFGLGAGILTVMIRIWGSYYDGVAFAILLMNMATPLFDRIKPKAYGRVKANG